MARKYDTKATQVTAGGTGGNNSYGNVVAVDKSTYKPTPKPEKPDTNDDVEKEEGQQQYAGAVGSGSGNATPASPTPTRVIADYNATPVAQRYDPVSDAAYQNALSALQNAQKNAPTYPGTYDSQLMDLYNQIVNRDKFKYDLNADMLYQQYAQQYTNRGNMAMQDTMGQAAALTGGYGSSYAQSVGQQQYDAYLQQLNDVIPDLYQNAYNQYKDEGDFLLQQYGMLGDLQQNEYDRYLDDYNMWLTERNYAQSAADTAYERGYDRWKDDYNIGLDRAEILAKSGDFSGYASFYGNDTANNMLNNWASENPDMAYRNGVISPEQYYALTGMYPAGYTPAGTGGGGGGGYGPNAANTAIANGVNALYESANGNANAVVGGVGNYLYSPKTSTQQPSNEIPDNATIENKNGTGWVAIGNSRYSYQELEQMVNNGSVVEIYDPKTNTVRYVK